MAKMLTRDIAFLLSMSYLRDEQVGLLRSGVSEQFIGTGEKSRVIHYTIMYGKNTM
jgi:hypothetical protein